MWSGWPGLSHKNVSYYASDLVVPDNRKIFADVLGRLQEKHRIVLQGNHDRQRPKQLGTTLWNIADTLRGAMNADDFRDYMLSFLFLRYLSDNYEAAEKKELREDYPDPRFPIRNAVRSELSMKTQRAAREVSGDNTRNGKNAYFVRGSSACCSFPNFLLSNSQPPV